MRTVCVVVALTCLGLEGCHRRVGGSSTTQLSAAQPSTCHLTFPGQGWETAFSTTRILELADLAGNRDGATTQEESKSLRKSLLELPRDAFSCHREEMLRATDKTTAGSVSLQISGFPRDPLKNLPDYARIVAMRADLEWGNGDAQVSLAELEAAGAFFMRLADIFPAEAAALSALRQQHIPPAQPPAPPTGIKALAAQILNNAMRRSAGAAPWLNAQPNFHSPEWHQFSVLEHIARTKEKMEYLLQKFKLDWSEGSSLMAVHDVGKIADRVWTKAPGDLNAGYSFSSHAEVGARILAEAGWLPGAFFVSEHEGVRKKTVEEIMSVTQDPTTRQRLVLVFLADNLGKGKTAKLDLEWNQVLGPKLLTLARMVQLNEAVLRDVFKEHGIQLAGSSL